MEPVTITTVATAIATIFFTKVIEKPGENLGQLLWEKTQSLVARLKGKSDKIAGLLEGTQQHPLDYGEAVLELKTLADKNSELAEAIKEVEAEANKESNPEFQQKLQEVREEADKLTEKEPIIQNLAKLADKINNLNQAHQITIHQNNTF
jgi:ribosomal protein S20